MDIRQQIDRNNKFINSFLKEKLTKKYLINNSWLSGSSTKVYPITISDRAITFQWDSDRNIFNKFIDRIVKNNNDLFEYGSFWKSDGSCPSTISFYFRKEN